MHELIELLRQQQASGFPDLAGTQVTAVVPVSAGLLDRMLSFEERQALIGLSQADAYERDLVARVDGRAPVRQG